MSNNVPKLTIRLISNIWVTLDELVRVPTEVAATEEQQGKIFWEASGYFDTAKRYARNGRSVPNFSNSNDRQTYEQCERFIKMLTPLYAQYDPTPKQAVNPHSYVVPNQDRT